MQEVRLEKVTANIGVGAGGEKLENAKTLLERITGKKVVATRAKVRNPTFKIQKGDEIGVKVTLRGNDAVEFAKKAFDAAENRVGEKSFDETGNVSFGVREYIDFPGAKYDPKIGMLGFDVCLTLKKPGTRVMHRRVARKKRIKQKVGRGEAIEFVKKLFGIEVVEEKMED
jgi:large subunit ribosomal protein L5